MHGERIKKAVRRFYTVCVRVPHDFHNKEPLFAYTSYTHWSQIFPLYSSVYKYLFCNVLRHMCGTCIKL